MLRTVQLQDLLQVGEDVLDVCGGQDGLFGELLVEHQVQHPQHADVRTLGVDQLCGDGGLAVNAEHKWTVIFLCVYIVAKPHR